MNKIAVVVAHPDDAEIWAGGTLLKHAGKGDKIIIIYPLEVEEKRYKETKISPFHHVRADDLEKSLTDFSPNIVLTHWALDSHPEHRKIFELVSSVLPRLVVFKKMQIHLYSFGTYGDVGIFQDQIFTPSVVISVVDYWDKKCELIKAYKSQDPVMWLKRTSKLDTSTGLNEGVDYAEGFLSVPILGKTNRLRKYLS